MLFTSGNGNRGATSPGEPQPGPSRGRGRRRQIANRQDLNARYLTRFGISLTSVDILTNSARYGPGDVARYEFRKHVEDGAERGLCDIIHAGTPCNTWEVARLSQMVSTLAKPMRTRDDPSRDWCTDASGLQKL